MFNIVTDGLTCNHQLDNYSVYVTDVNIAVQKSLLFKIRMCIIHRTMTLGMKVRIYVRITLTYNVLKSFLIQLLCERLEHTLGTYTVVIGYRHCCYPVHILTFSWPKTGSTVSCNCKPRIFTVPAYFSFSTFRFIAKNVISSKITSFFVIICVYLSWLYLVVVLGFCGVEGVLLLLCYCWDQLCVCVCVYMCVCACVRVRVCVFVFNGGSYNCVTNNQATKFKRLSRCPVLFVSWRQIQTF